MSSDIRKLCGMGQNILLPYWKVCRRYRYVAEQIPSEWAQAPFILTKVCAH